MSKKIHGFDEHFGDRRKPQQLLYTTTSEGNEVTVVVSISDITAQLSTTHVLIYMVNRSFCLVMFERLIENAL